MWKWWGFKPILTFCTNFCGKINSQLNLRWTQSIASQGWFFCVSGLIGPMLIFFMLSLQSCFMSQANMGFCCCVCSTLWISLSCPTNCARANSLREKWWQTFLEIKVSCSQGEGSTCTHERFNILLLEGEKRGHCYFFPLVPNVFLSCSHEVLKLFPNTFAIAPQIYHIWFAQSSTPIYIAVTKI